MKGFCSEFGAQQKVQIDFGYSNIPDSIPQETSLCLFRILQEGLTNAVRHSGVGHFDARLSGLHGEVELTVRDSGKGFDPEAAESNRGLGLVSMLPEFRITSFAGGSPQPPRFADETRRSEPLMTTSQPFC